MHARYELRNASKADLRHMHAVKPWQFMQRMILADIRHNDWTIVALMQGWGGWARERSKVTRRSLTTNLHFIGSRSACTQ